MPQANGNGSKQWVHWVVAGLMFIGGVGTTIGVNAGTSKVQDVQIQDLKVQITRMEETRQRDFVSKDTFVESQKNIVDALTRLEGQLEQMNKRMERRDRKSSD